MFPVVYLDVTDLLNLITTLGPQWAGYLIAIGCVLYVLRIINKMSTNALHGVADTNNKIMESQNQLVMTLQDISSELKEHSFSDAKIFDQIRLSLVNENVMLIQAASAAATSSATALNAVSNNLLKQGEILVRLDERTRDK